MKEYTAKQNEFLYIECEPHSGFTTSTGVRLVSNGGTLIGLPLGQYQSITCNKDFEIKKVISYAD